VAQCHDGFSPFFLISEENSTERRLDAQHGEKIRWDASIFQSTNDHEMRNRFQYRMILKSRTPGAGVFLSLGVPAEAGEWVQGEGASV
jgi:hypothetical protein